MKSYLVSYDSYHLNDLSVIPAINIKPRTAYIKLYEGLILVKTSASLSELMNSLRGNIKVKFMIAEISEGSFDGLSDKWQWIKENIY